MRINQESILEIAREEVGQRTSQAPTIVAAYLCGSALEKDFALGGTFDIDLVFIHIDLLQAQREIVRVTDDIHLDIAHHPQRDYEQPRRLRIDPWLGPTVFDCKPLYDKGHVMDFIQASVRGLFSRPDTVMERARPLAEKARRRWLAMENNQTGKSQPNPAGEYLAVVALAANAIALLSGASLVERRFLLQFLERAKALGKPGLYAGLLGLIGAADLDRETIRQWLPVWRSLFQAVPQPPANLSLHASRLNYYQRGIEVLLEGIEPRAALWPLLSTGTVALDSLKEADEARKGWNEVYQQLGLSGEELHTRLEALDAFLDLVEETLDEWAEQNGA